MNCLFISDLHLNEERPDISAAFFRFLREQTGDTQALYILGDFFDTWVGDDDDSALAQTVAEQLLQLSRRGTRICLMHGNRDFLLGDAYAARCGAQMLAEGSVIDLFGRPALLMHGDSLCTGDSAYMAFRQQVRSPAWQAQLLAQPLAARRALAAQLREKSQAMNAMKAEDIMDVTPREVEKTMTAAGVDLLIHGHTHRPARHPLTLNQQPAERIVLGDWHHFGWCLYASATELSLRHWDINA